MNTKRAILAVLSAAVLSGCLVADERLPANETPSADSPLLGYWQAPWPAMLSRDTLNVLYVPGRDHYYAVRGRGKYFGADLQGEKMETQNIRQYRAYPSRVGNRLFFSLVPVRAEKEPVLIVEPALEGRQLVIREPSDEAVERAIAGGKLNYRLEEDSKVVTSSGEAVAAWLATLEPGDFKVQDVFERRPSTVDELAARLEKKG